MLNESSLSYTVSYLSRTPHMAPDYTDVTLDVRDATFYCLINLNSQFTTRSRGIYLLICPVPLLTKVVNNLYKSFVLDIGFIKHNLVLIMKTNIPLTK